jgi:TolB-like protein/Tfp pilus assembly protein PilF
MGLVSELRRRNVFRMAVLYVVAAWLIMQVAGVLMDLGALPVAAGPWVLVVLVIGLPMALGFSWLFEITPEGLALEKDVPEGASITHITGRRMDFIVIAVLSAGLILFAYDKWWPRDPLELSIAVLPFDNMSGEPEQEYFSDGISEELLNVLSRLPGLRVVARTSSFQFKGENRDVIEIGQKLNTAFVLEGSVRKADGQVRITAQLIDASNGFHLWSDTYDRELENIFAVQDEISAAIVGALKEQLGLQLSAAPRVVAASSNEAHEAYLRGRFLVVQRTRTGFEGAVREFEKAIALDPDYAAAHAELAIAILLRSGYGNMFTTEAISMATSHASRAMVLDPGLAEAHAATGFLALQQWQSEEALTHFEQAIRINPNYAIVYNWISITLTQGHGRYGEGVAALEKAVQLDPLSRAIHSTYVGWLINLNRLAEAEKELDKLASIHPANHAERRGRLTSLGGKWANAAFAILDALRLEPDRVGYRGGLAMSLATLDLSKEALAIGRLPLPPHAMYWLGEHEDAVLAARAALAEYPISLRYRRNLGLALAGAGDFANAGPILEEIWQRSGKRVTRSGLIRLECAAALVAMRRDAGDEGGADELVAAMRADIGRQKEAGATLTDMDDSVDYSEGLADYLAGERERGLALIARAAEDGFFIPPHEAYLQTLYDDPGFAPIRAIQEARQVREREKFLTIVCNDNPYASVWQPAEGTCEQFAAASRN